MNVIEINKLGKTYRNKKFARVEALKNLSLEVASGEVFGFLGPNGAGKSTTIKSLMGLIRPTEGGASLFGVPISDWRCRLKVGFLPENPSFYDFLSAREYLDFVGRTFKMDGSQLELRIDEVLERFDLLSAAKRPLRSYSKGMVQRLGLAQAVLHDPDLYIFDEPMSGLDPLGRALVKDLIRELKGNGKTIFFSSHITADMEAICDRVGVILKGELQRAERVEDLLIAGIEGYRVLYLEQGSDEQKEIILPQEALSQFLSEAQQQGKKISLVEPHRKDLEAYFLDIVKANQ